MQNKVLIVDGDTRSLRLLEVSLKQAGYRVGTATSGLDALGQLEVEVPDLLLVDTAIGEVDGFALYARLQQRPEWAHLPFIFILDGEDATQKLRAVQLGVSDFLTKPVFLKEALSRVELLLEKQAQRGEGPLGKTPTSGRARFSGALSGTALLDLLQTMELGRKSGIAYCQSGRGQRAVVYFAGGVVVNAELGRLRGTEALYRILTFQGGEYRVELLAVVRPARIEMSTPGLLMEAMRFLEEWNRLCAALPPLTSALLPATLGGAAGALRPESLPRELREVLQLFDGQRSVLDVLDILDQEAEPPHDLLLRVGAVAKLYAARLLTLAGRPVSGELRAPVPTPLAVPRLIPPAARLTPPPLPRLTPPPAARLTPPPMPRLTPPPLLAGRAAALSSSGRPTPVSLPRAVVKTPAPLADSAAVTLPAELLITLVPGQPPPRPAGLAQAGESPAAATDEYPTPRPSSPAVPPTQVEQPVVRGTARSLPPALPRAAGGATPPLPQLLASPRPTPPPLPAQEVVHHTPAVPMAASPLPAPALSSEAAQLKQTMRWSGQATPTALSAQEALRHPSAVAMPVSPPALAPKPEAAHLKQTMRWSGQAAPTLPPAHEASRYTPAVPTEASPPPAPETHAEAAHLRQTMPGVPKLTPPPMPAHEASRYTPAVPTEASPPAPETHAEAAQLRQTMPRGPRLTPPPMPAHEASRYTPAVPTEASPPPAPETHAEAAQLRTMPGGPRLTPPPMPLHEASRYTPAVPTAVSPALAPVPDLEVAQLKQTMPRGARLTPPPLPAREALHVQPAVSAMSVQRALPQAQVAAPPVVPESARLTPPPVVPESTRLTPPPVVPGSTRLTPPPVVPGSTRLTPPPVVPGSTRLTPPPIPARDISRLTPAVGMSMWPATPDAEEESLEAEALDSAWLSSSALCLEAEPPEVAGSARPTPPLLSFAAGPLEPALPASARLTPPPFASLDASRLTPVLESRATPPPLPDEAPTWVPLGGAAAGASDSSAAQRNNLTRLAQRLAATRQPLPFVAPSQPSSAGAAYSAQANSEPGFAAAVQMTAAGETSGQAAGPVRGGSVPELEPISIPDFELMIEHSAPSWLPAPDQDSVTPSSELRGNKTLPVQLRSQYRAASADAVHLSAPVLLPADPASAVLPPIEVEVPPAPLFMPPPARGTPVSRQRWGKVVAWVVAGTALFSLGAGLYWVRQELDRGIAMPGQKSAPPTAARPESPVSEQSTARQPRVGQPATGPAASRQPAGAQPMGGEPAGSRPTGGEPMGAQPAGAQPMGAQPMGAQPMGAQPMGAQPMGAQPAGAQPMGAQPMGAQPMGAQPAGAQPAGAHPVIGEPTGALARSATPTAEVAAAAVPTGRPTAEAPAAVPMSAGPAGAPAPAPTSARPAAPPTPASPTGAVVAAAPSAVGQPADPAARVEATPPVASGAFATLIGKARAFEHRGALAAAYHAAHGAQRLQPRSAEVFALLAQLALDEGNADKAAGLAKRARYLDPRNADAYLVLGTVEQARSRPASARTFFKKYLELAPNGERAVEVRAVLHSGR